MTEQWKPIEGFDRYEVSDLGRVRRIERSILVPDTPKGYHRVKLSQYGKLKRFQVHRLVAAAFIGKCPEGYQVNHKDGCRTNNTPSNLEYVTSQENHRHSWEVLGRKPARRGSATHFAKLTDQQVIQIRRLRSEGHKLKDIGDQFGVLFTTVWHICQGKTWKHLL